MNRENFIVEPADTYHDKAKQFLSSHQLADFRKCPTLYHQKQTGQIKSPDSAAYFLGRAAHTRILEGQDQFNKEYIVGGPINPSTGQPYGPTSKKFLLWQEEQGKEILSISQADLIEKMGHSVRGHKKANDLLSNGVAEGVIRTTYCDVPCQIRMDWFNFRHGILVDLKTCNNLDWFENDAKRYEYAHQLSFYRSVYHQATGIYIPVFMVAVEKEIPHRTGVWLMDPDILDQAESENESAIAQLIECRETNNWDSEYQEVRVFDSIYPSKSIKKEIRSTNNLNYLISKKLA